MLTDNGHTVSTVMLCMGKGMFCMGMLFLKQLLKISQMYFVEVLGTLKKLSHSNCSLWPVAYGTNRNDQKRQKILDQAQSL